MDEEFIKERLIFCEYGESFDLGIDFKIIEEILVLEKFIDQVIGQEYVVEVIKMVVNQRRYVFFIGEFGIGKLMFG